MAQSSVAIMRLNSVCIDSWKRDADRARPSQLTPPAISMQFQWVRGLGDRRNVACGICGRKGWRSCDNSLPCRGRHDEHTSLAQQVERALRIEQCIHYAILALAALLQFIISPDWHTSCFTDKTSCLATNKANLGRPQSLAVQLSFGRSTVCQGRSHVVA